MDVLHILTVSWMGMEETTPTPPTSPEPSEPKPEPAPQIKFASSDPQPTAVKERRKRKYTYKRMNPWGRGDAKYVDAAGVAILRNNRHPLTCTCRFCVEKMAKNPVGDVRRERKPLDAKAARFIKFFSDPKSPTYLKKRASMTKAGYSITRQSASLGITAKRAILAAFEKAGVGATILAERVRAGLDATKTEIISYKGEVTAQIDKTDFTERRQMVELAMRVRQDVPHDDPAAGAQVHLHIPTRLSPAAWDAEVTATPTLPTPGTQSPYPERRSLTEAPTGSSDGIYEEDDDILTEEDSE